MSTPSTRNIDPFVESEDFDARARILLVEDNRGDSELIRVVLTQNIASTVEVVQCCRLNEAFQCLENESFQAIVLDLGLPDSKGLETLERMLKAARSIPVVVLTGREDLDLAQAAIRLGAQECLCKNRVSGELLVRTITSSIERQKALSCAIDLSPIDELTGLHNRRGLLTMYPTLLNASRCSDLPLTVIYVDLNNLERINDSFGHGSGDQALIATAQLLRAAFCKTDFICRIGGDAFLVIVVGDRTLDEPLILQRLEEQRAQANSLPSRTYDLSWTIGVVQLSSHDHRSAADLLSEADHRLDEYKRSRQESLADQ